MQCNRTLWKKGDIYLEALGDRHAEWKIKKGNLENFGDWKKWEQKLTASGWIKVEATLRNLADSTWYSYGKAPEGKTRDWVYYISPNGKEVYFKNRQSGFTDTGTRRVQIDRTRCITWKKILQGNETCGITLWKKGDKYRRFRKFGNETGTWTIKKGNLEKF